MAANNNNKMKGLLKGLRYISQIFDEKEPEMQIGLPTDVKHVAHIGWDGPSVNSAPSWMNEFSASQENASKDDSTLKLVTQDSNCSVSKASNYPASAPSSPARSFPGVPKSSRRQISKGESGDSPTKQKSDKPRRRSAKTASKDLSQGSKSSSDLPDKPRKPRAKKSKDGRSRSKASASDMDNVSESGSVSKSLKGGKCVDVDDASETGSVSRSPRSSLGRLDEVEEKGFTGIS